MSTFLTELRESLHSEILTDDVSKKLYAVDASIYEIEPLAIVIPRSEAELIKAVQIAHKHKVAIIPRGAATGITGACLGEGLVLDLSVHLNKIIAIDYEKEIAVVQPGVIQDQLNHALEAKGYRLGPDTSTGNRATIGGMVGNNAAGAHTLKFGRMIDHVEEAKLILASGEIIHLKELTREELEKKLQLPGSEGDIYRTVKRLAKEYRDDIENDFPKIERRASGYNLNELIKPNFSNLCKLITGSEGTLGITSEITLKICKRPHHRALVIIAARNMLEGLKYTKRYLDFKPYAMEMIDKTIIEMGKLSPSLRGKLSWLKTTPDALFVVEFESDSSDELKQKIKTFYDAVKSEPYIAWLQIIEDAKIQDEVWLLRKSGLGLLLSRRSNTRAFAFIEDLTVLPDNLSLFVEKLTSYLASHHKEAGIYGHIGDGCLHIRPYIDMTKSKELELMKKILEDMGALVKSLHGTLSGEHGDGFLRSWINPKMFGERLYKAFQELKFAFDPDLMMNPGKIIATQDFLPTDKLRLSPQTKTRHFETFFDFKREGGIELAADLCNGNGQCRKKEGLMCPSFQASNLEKDSTRARANVLRALFHEKLSPKDILSSDFYDVMDLCIQCKGCKTECPSQVDMAKMKAEYLYHYHQKKGFPLRSYFFGYIGSLFRLGTKIPKISNFFIKNRLTKWLLSRIGISPKRKLPLLTKKPFSKIFHAQNEHAKSVVLFSDTFTEFTAPEIGMKALYLLERLGYNVIVPKWHCCGRTFISKGLLEQAKKKADKLVELLHPYAAQGIPIVGLEPSCILTIKDEFRDFHLDQNKVNLVIHHTKTIDEFLEGEMKQLSPQLQPFDGEILLHGHCHQKSLVGMKPTINILKSIPHAEVKEIASGCCGMAGSFGYEKEHVDFSLQIGELALFPAVRQKSANSVVIANGVSCRSQIEDGTAQKALHLVEFLITLLK